MENEKIFLGIILIIISLVGGIIYFFECGLPYQVNVGDHLKRAADSNTVELARAEMFGVVNYLEKNGYTEGYTSVVYKTPDEDVGFWYRNLNASLDELNKINENSTALEKSNVLMKLRETILDDGQAGNSVTAPPGIASFPNNFLWKLPLIMPLFGVILFMWGISDE